MTMTIPLVLPELTLLIAGLFFFGASLGKTRQGLLQWAAVAFGLFALFASVATYSESGLLFHNVYKVDAFSQTFKILISLGLVLVLWCGSGLKGISRQFAPEYYLFMFLSCFGLCIMVSAVELLTIIISLEIASYALYVLIPLRRQQYQREPLEASIKYVFFGGAATAISLYGMSYIFGMAHSTYLIDLSRTVPGLLEAQPLVVIGFVMLLCGLFYKLALFPLHFWMPDVFVGAAHETTCFIATLPKVGAAALLLRFIALAGANAATADTVLAGMAVFSMTVGNLSALGQQDIKRLLAYSSIAHAGYIMVGMLTLNLLGLSASVYYIYGYVFMNTACFYVLYQLAPRGENLQFGDLRGLYRRSPLLAATLAIGAIGLSGIPPTIGFTGKFLIFAAAVQQQYYWLVGFALGNVCVSAFYYLRIVRAAYSSVQEPVPPVNLSLQATLFAIVIITAIIIGGIYPQHFFEKTMSAVALLL